MNGLPAKHFAFGPYCAEQIGPTWWGVANRNGFNCLTFAEKPGAVVTDEAHARQIADEWNETKEFVYPTNFYSAAATQRMTDEEMSAYIHSRRYNFETRKWK